MKSTYIIWSIFMLVVVCVWMARVLVHCTWGYIWDQNLYTLNMHFCYASMHYCAEIDDIMLFDIVAKVYIIFVVLYIVYTDLMYINIESQYVLLLQILWDDH